MFSRLSPKQAARKLFLLYSLAACATRVLADIQLSKARASLAQEENGNANSPTLHQTLLSADESSGCSHQEFASRSNSSSSSLARTSNFCETTACPIQARRDRLREMRARGEHKWRLDYHEELAPGFEVRLLDNSLDERLANLIHTVNTARIVNIDFYSFNSGDPQVDLRNIEATAGPEVDDNKCRQQLRAMVGLLDDLGERLERKRANSSFALNLDERHIRLARVLDSYGRYESGQMSGRALLLGHHDQCLETSLLLPETMSTQRAKHERVATRYCLAGLGVAKHLDSGLKGRARTPFESAHDRLMMAVCLPRSCHTKTFKGQNRELIERLTSSQFRLPQSLYIDNHLKLESLYCMPDWDSPQAGLSFNGKLAVLFFIGWFMATLYATISSEPSVRNNGSLVASIMECLNLRTSIENLLGQHKLSSAELEKRSAIDGRQLVDLEVLNTIKVAGCAIVLLGHVLMIYNVLNQDGLRSYHSITNDPAVMTLITGTYVVDTFFVITGVLMGYHVMKRSASLQRAVANGRNIMSASNGHIDRKLNGERTNKLEQDHHVGHANHNSSNQLLVLLKHWLKFAITRHLRLVPLMLLVFWFHKSVFIDLFSGSPMWDSGFNRETPNGACREQGWLTQFTLQAAFLPFSKQCLAQTWSVATDLFFSIIAPPVMLLLPSRPNQALLLGALMTIISFAWATLSFYSLDAYDMQAFRDISCEAIVAMFGRLHYIYTYPHHRIASIMMGILAGYILYKYSESRQRQASMNQTSVPQTTWPQWMIALTWLAALAIVLIPTIYCLKAHVKDFIPDNRLIFSNLFSTVRVIWATSNAVLFVRMCSDWNQYFLLRLFAGPLMQTLSKLNYAILLIHIDVMIYLVGSRTSAFYFSKLGLLNDFGAVYFYCIPLATFVYVVYEYPIDKLVRRFVMPQVDRLFR